MDGPPRATPNAVFPRRSLEYNAIQNLGLAQFASAEAQAAALADGIAYNAHDIDDGLRSGAHRFSRKWARSISFACIGGEIAALYPGLEPVRAIHELVRRLITLFIEDAICREPAADRGVGCRECGRCAGVWRTPDRLFQLMAGADKVDLDVSVREYVPASTADPNSGPCGANHP